MDNANVQDAQTLDSSAPVVRRKRERRVGTLRLWYVVSFCGVLGLLAFILSAINIRELKQEAGTLRKESEIMRLEVRTLRSQLDEVQKHVPFPSFDQLKSDLKRELGVFDPETIRRHKDSFVELYSYDDQNNGSYGTAGYLGHGYFITVKHGVVALGQEGLADPRRVELIKLLYNNRFLKAKIIDSGDAVVEVDEGDWAVIRVEKPEQLDLPVLRLDLGYDFEFGETILRLGNDYSKGIIASTGYVGTRLPNSLVTSLTDGHPGVSGGGVISQQEKLIGMTIGRMREDYRFSFILPLRREMFRKVPHLNIRSQR